MRAMRASLTETGWLTDPSGVERDEARLEWPRRGAVLVLRAYQRVISPLLPPRCRYWPTCSEYARLAVARQGLARGAASSIARLLRCHPGRGGGIDLPR